MLTRDDTKKIHLLKGRGYSIRRAALKLGLNPKTVRKYWGEDFQSMEDNLYFAWVRCPRCGAYFPAPKFLKKFLCPTCDKRFYWKKIWYKPMEDVQNHKEVKKVSQKSPQEDSIWNL